MLASNLMSENTKNKVKIYEIGIANPKQRFLQKDIPYHMEIKNPKLKKFFEHDHIEYRHLFIPSNMKFKKETNNDLLKRFVTGAIEITEKALLDCILKAKLKIENIDLICCVTSTGFIVPPLSARFIKHFGMRENCQRVDIVGMGCSAGLNGLNTVTNWCNRNPNKNALLICVEICSAIYTIDDTPRTAVVNSLFGDGVAVALVKNDHNNTYSPKPTIIDFESHLIPDHIEELRFDWDENKNSYSFFVGKDTPRVMSEIVDQPLARLLTRNSINKTQIKHWILHGGGNSVLIGMMDKLHLTDNDLKYTRSVLKDFGNLSSGSFLFSFKRLIEEETIHSGDFGLMITMGPGLAIEMALLKWEE